MLRRTQTIGFLCMLSSSLTLIGTVRGLATTRTMSHNSNRLLIVDTDVGFDDLVALQCLLNARATAHSNGSSQPLVVTTVGGVVSAQRGLQVLRGLFPQVEISAGKNSPMMPFDPLPDWLHNYRTETLAAFARDRNIHYVDSSSMPEESSDAHNDDDDDDDSNKSSNRNIVKRILEVPDNGSVDILAIGPLTNLSEWLARCERQNEKDDNTIAQTFASKINSIYMLGGNHPSLAHTLKEPEFNFGLDPAAAQHVLTSPLLRDKIHLITSSVCNMGKLTAAIGNEHMQSFIQEEHTRSIDSSCGFYRSILQYDTVAYSLSCDPVCAFAMEYPESVTWEQVSVSVDADSGKLAYGASASKRGHNNDSTSDKKEATSIRIASDINLKEYLSWVRTTIHSTNS